MSKENDLFRGVKMCNSRLPHEVTNTTTYQVNTRKNFRDFNSRVIAPVQRAINFMAYLLPCFGYCKPSSSPFSPNVFSSIHPRYHTPTSPLQSPLPPRSQSSPRPTPWHLNPAPTFCFPTPILQGVGRLRRSVYP